LSRRGNVEEGPLEAGATIHSERHEIGESHPRGNMRTPGDARGLEARCAAIFLRVLARHGVRVAFGIPGGAIGPFFDALADCPEIEYVPTRHEATAVYAAMGHARMTGVPALVLTTAGPGVTNAVTGAAAALAEELPVIVLGGEVSSFGAGRGGFQEGTQAGLDVVSIMRPVTRWSSTVVGPSMAAGAAERAWSMATAGRPGPVFLSVPFDVAQGSSFESFVAGAPATAAVPDEGACRAAARCLADANRPLLVLGSGARGAARELRQIAERIAAPVVVTGHAKGVFPERHPLYLGIIGNAGHPSVEDYLSERPDVVCVFGSRLGDLATNGWSIELAGSKATIQIDRDPWLIGRNAPVTLGIVGDAQLSARSMLRALPVKRPRPMRFARGCRSYPWVDSEEGRLKPQSVLSNLARAFPDAIWCSDIGEHMGMAQHYLRVDRPDQFHCMSGLAAMGSGMGAAIGIQHARPDATVVAIVGDGGFNMHVAEMLTCVDQRLSVIYAVFNDGCWNMVDHGFHSVFGRVPPSLPHRVADLAGVARAYGAEATVIEAQHQLSPVLLRSLHHRGRPLVLDFRTDREEVLSTRSRSVSLRQLSRGSHDT
jgi:acetolactate synthase-1/2/3 large subunit